MFTQLGPTESKRLVQLVVLILGLSALFLLTKTWQTAAEAVQVGKPVPYEYTLNIEGIGIAYARPDVSKVSFMVESRNPTIEEAQKDNTARTNSVIEKLISAGVESKDIQTTYYNSYEDTFYSDIGDYKTRGWIVTQNLELVIRDLEKISTIIGLLGQNNVSNITGPSFTVEDDQVAMQEAREKALADAKNKIDSIAKELNIDIGMPTGYSEWKEDMPSGGYSMKSEIMDASAPTMAPEPTIEAGQNMIKLHVTVSYLINR